MKTLQLNSNMRDCSTDSLSNNISWDISKLRFNSESRFSVNSIFVKLRCAGFSLVTIDCNLIERNKYNSDGVIFCGILDKRSRSANFFIDHKPSNLTWWPLDCSNPQKLTLHFNADLKISLDFVSIVLNLEE